MPAKSQQPSLAATLVADLVSLARGCAIATFMTIALFPHYAALVRWMNLSDRAAFCVLTMAVHGVLYFGVNAVSLFALQSKWFLKRFHIPRKPSHEPSKELIRETIVTNLIAQLTVQPLTLYYVAWPAFLYFGTSESLLETLPSASTLAGQFLLCCLFNDWFFYWSHRMMHSIPALYRAVHKQHHKYNGSIGFAAEYAHPVEQLLSNQLPTIGGALFFGFHPLVWLVWLSWRLLQTYETHSGIAIELPAPLSWMGLTDPEGTRWHDDHHAINTGNYGSPFLDHLFGTAIPSA